MSFLAVIPLEYSCLDGESPENVIKFFRKKISQEDNALQYYIDLQDFLKTWCVSNPRKAKQMVKEHCLKQLIGTYIRADDGSLKNVFEEVRIEDEMLSVWISARAMPYLINVHLSDGGFTYRVPIELLKPFRSVYTVKLFERLVRFSDTGTLYLTPSSLKDITGAKSSDYPTLKRDVLLKAERELLKYGLLKREFRLKTEKNGRKVSKIKLDFVLADHVRPPRDNITKTNNSPDITNQSPVGIRLPRFEAINQESAFNEAY